MNISKCVLVVALLSLCCKLSFGSSCGETTIPFSFEILPTGQPVLGCARPTCFGWDPKGYHLPTDARFVRIDRKRDGFLRDDPIYTYPFTPDGSKMYLQQNSTCEPAFQSAMCDSKIQWVGGVEPVQDVNSTHDIAYQCCTYPPLRESTDRGMTLVAAGQIVIGGEVFKNGSQYAFDYISNIAKNIDEYGKIFYEVNVRRLACLDPHNADRSVDEIWDSENTIRKVNGKKAMAHQVPNVAVGNAVPQYNVYPAVAQQPAPYSYLPAAPQCQQYYCFPNDAVVNVYEKAVKRMDELEIGDWVEALDENGEDITFLPVKYWLHRDPEQEAEFLEFSLDNGETFTLTEKHLVYTTECRQNSSELKISWESISAGKVNAGDCFYLAQSEALTKYRLVEILDIKRVKKTGIYAPMTSQGHLLVNKIHTSCHSEVDHHILQNSFFKHVLKWKNKITKYFWSYETERNIGQSLNSLIAIFNLVVPSNMY
ncbi:Warthog protein 1 [Caenorhabditis elegans]|uniref:Warthog protein 1 n=1 Tax=Caenorhabditis elegans TaxID=6239 RepID=O45992_CAEEL|nr:Warthog protein 1 [Caenorhabditis elegans]CAB03509.2 Warthog protein 1 [Caenorhabditis elegans]|eukprot:NP_506803.2 WaRThog (hedgehog-like family) [Caenorhabditis elegans]